MLKQRNIIDLIFLTTLTIIIIIFWNLSPCPQPEIDHKRTTTTINDLIIVNIPQTINQEMAQAIVEASQEFNVPVSLIVGIANAESSLGQNYYNQYDKDHCYNLWGLKGGNTNKRQNSYLRCFNDAIGGARTVAKVLRLYYLDENRITPEQIADKWVGRNNSEYHQTWINNVNEYYLAN